MIPIASLLFGYVVVFVRTSTCLMLLPGFSSIQIAMPVRLYVAISISIAIYPLAQQSLSIPVTMDGSALAVLILSEMLIAAAIALPLRFLFLALSFLGEVITMLIGLNPIPGTPIADNQSSTILSGFFNLASIVLFFATGLHISFIFALTSSFVLYPPGELISIAAFLERTVKDLDMFFNIAIRLGAPLIIYGVIMNFIAGLINKLTPQIPVYFVSTPFLIFGGLIILTWIGDDIILLFHLELARFLNDRF